MKRDIVWQRFCEPAKLRIAYCLCVWLCVCVCSVACPSPKIDKDEILLVFAHNQYFFYICHDCTSLPDKLSAEDCSLLVRNKLKL